MENKDKKDKRSGGDSSGLAVGMCIGLAIGTAIGAATGNIGTWLPIGLCLGLSLGGLYSHKNGGGENEDENGADSEE